MKQAVQVEVMAGSVLMVEADVLALKYAQAFHGADQQVAIRLPASRQPDITPGVGSYRFLPSAGAIRSKFILFVGVVELNNFRYGEIRKFSSKVLSSLAGEAPATEVLALTLHGAGYGLDERECFLSELAGLVDAIESGDYPAQLRTVRIVEQNERRVERLRDILDSYLPGGRIYPDTRVLRQRIGDERSNLLRSTGYESEQKPHIFVAMPFSESTGDLYHYGIYQAINSVGRLCERSDLTPAVGDIMARVKEMIKSAEFVVAELTGSNPNVYLEVGYAWGCGVPTLLLIHKDEAKNILFDVQGQRHIAYTSIHDLEERLSAQLKGLLAKG